MNHPRSNRWGSGFRKVAETGCGFFAALAWLAVALITVVDVMGRWAFSMQVYGAYEWVKLFMAIGIFLSIPVVVLRRRQVTVNLLSHAISARSQERWAAIGAIIGAGCFAMITFALWNLTLSYLRSGETTTLLELPLWMIAGFMAVISGFVACCCVLSIWTGETQEDQGGNIGA